MAEFIGMIVACPVCSSAEDAESEGWVELECDNCGTEFKVKVEADKAAEFGLYG